MRPRALAVLTALFCGLTAVFGGLSLAARGRAGLATLTAAAGLAVVAAAWALLRREPRGG